MSISRQESAIEYVFGTYGTDAASVPADERVRSVVFISDACPSRSGDAFCRDEILG